MTLRGIVRATDLDIFRFDVRQIHEGALNDIRCVYKREVPDTEAKTWLNQYVTVTGEVERDNEGRPRLMKVERVELQGSAEGPSQEIMSFDQ